MDDLEKYIRENRVAFEEKGPDGKVWDRLKKSLPEHSTTQKRERTGLRISQPFKKWAAVAAVFVLAVFFVAFIRTYQVKKELNRQVIPTDLLEARAYYLAQIKFQITQIKRLKSEQPSGDTAMWTMFEKDGEEYVRLKKALSENPNNPHVKAAFVEYYRARLEVLKRVHKRLKQQSSIKK